VGQFPDVNWLECLQDAPKRQLFDNGLTRELFNVYISVRDSIIRDSTVFSGIYASRILVGVAGLASFVNLVWMGRLTLRWLDGFSWIVRYLTKIYVGILTVERDEKLYI
jgi:hypothetical protein